MTNYLQGGDYEKVSGRLGMESQKTQEKTIAFLGSINYNWNDIFLFTGSLRHEGNSKFGVDHKWGTFPAASAAWRMSKLPVFENSGMVDDLKLRFSYGVTGRSGFDRYISFTKYSDMESTIAISSAGCRGMDRAITRTMTWLGRSRSLTTWVSTIPCSNLACLVAWTSLSATVKT